MMRAFTCFLTLSMFACAAPPSEAPDSTPSPADAAGERVVGTVRVVGSAPVNIKVVVQPEQGKSIEVVGPLREELRQLGGALVALSGLVEPAPDPLADRQIRVDTYEIVSIDGEPVVSGTIESRSGEGLILRTASGEAVFLSGATAQFRPGQKVWVQGPRSVTVQTYGVLRH